MFQKQEYSESDHHQKGALIEELNRASAENKKLKQMLTEVSENYNELRNQFMECTTTTTTTTTNNNIKNGVDHINYATTPSRKRKAEQWDNNNVNADNRSDSSSSDEDSSKKRLVKPMISTVRLRTEASDTSLVSPNE